MIQQALIFLIKDNKDISELINSATTGINVEYANLINLRFQHQKHWQTQDNEYNNLLELRILNDVHYINMKASKGLAYNTSSLIFVIDSRELLYLLSEQINLLDTVIFILCKYFNIEYVFFSLDCIYDVNEIIQIVNSPSKNEYDLLYQKQLAQIYPRVE